VKAPADVPRPGPLSPAPAATGQDDGVPATPEENIRPGPWKELILNGSGGIDWSLYARVAAGYHTRPVLHNRFGPSHKNFAPPWEKIPTLHQPYPDGIYRHNAGKWARVNPGPDGDPGAGWMMSGQLLFSPDPNAPREMAAGCANARAADGAIGPDKGLCMRLRCEWTPDWWNRNSISVPTCPAIPRLRKIYPDLPLPPVATARGKGGASVTGFLVFANGVVGVAGTGNDPYTSEGFDYPHTRLPPGKFPTAAAVTPNNEFVLITVWNPAEKKGQLAVIAVEGRQMAQEKRFYWGLAGGWPTVLNLKYLGCVDLPFAAPISIDATVDITLGNPRGHGDNVNDDLSRQDVRDRWHSAHQKGDALFWKRTARFGYAIVASRAENGVALVDLRPLLGYYRRMYLTTAENFAQTRKAGPGKDQWPFPFEHAPEQKPRVVAHWRVPQPTAVSTGAGRGSFIPPRAMAKDPLGSLKTAYVATLNGTVALYDVSPLFQEVPAQPLPAAPYSSFKAGRNPVQIFRGYHSTRPDDLFVVSRGDRSITYAEYDGKVRAVLRDARILDPVGCVVSLDQAGFGGSGAGKAVHTSVLTVLDFEGRQVLDYAVDSFSGDPEKLDLRDEKGQKVPFLFFFANPLPGCPFMFTVDEVI